MLLSPDCCPSRIFSRHCTMTQTFTITSHRSQVFTFISNPGWIGIGHATTGLTTLRSAHWRFLKRNPQCLLHSVAKLTRDAASKLPPFPKGTTSTRCLCPTKQQTVDCKVLQGRQIRTQQSTMTIVPVCMRCLALNRRRDELQNVGAQSSKYVFIWHVAFIVAIHQIVPISFFFHTR
jgi:hypothetical protein